MSVDLQKIGKLLKEKREEKGLTINDISDALCLRKSLVEAIENGKWDFLPHEIYVRGYLREYAEIVDIKSEVGWEIEQSSEVAGAVEAPIQQKVATKRLRIKKRVIIYPLMLVLVVAFFILNETTSKVHNTARKSMTGQVTKQASVSTHMNRGEQKGLTELVDVKKLIISCHERTWVSIVIDGTEKKEFMLNPEEFVVLNAKDNFDLLVGNAGGVKLFLNGKNVELTGQSGEVKRIKVS